MADLLTANKNDNVTLVDALDKVLEKGVVINGDIMIRVADVDLVYLGLRLILTSVSKAEELSGKSFSNPDKEFTPDDIAYIQKLQREIKKAEENIPKLIDLGSPKKTEQGLAQLVLTLLELIRKLMEKEAFRRVKRGSLSQAEVQKLGLSLKAVKKKIQEVQAIFGIKDEDIESYINDKELGNWFEEIAKLLKNSDKVKADLGLLIGIALLTSKGDIESLDTVWFIGGESIYKDYIDLCSEVWVTVMKFDSLKVFLAPVENVLEVKEKVSFFSPLVKRIHHYNYYEVALYTQPSGFTLDHCLELAQENEPKNFEIRKYVRV